MIKLVTSRLTPAEIGKENTTFRIPLYQRPYAWDSAQVTQLLDDLHKADDASDYHIGILSVAKTSDGESRMDLIDGQQRITTLMLIGKAASSYFGEWENFNTPDRLHLYGRKEDQAFLVGGKEDGCNRRMLDAFGTAKEYFDKLKNIDARKKFSEYIYRHAAFFLSEVPEQYTLLDKNQQFVRMNNRGKQLEKHEILKVKLLSKIKNSELKDQAFSDWNEMVDLLTGISKENQNDQSSLESILALPGNGRVDLSKEPLYSSIVSVPEFLLIALARFVKNTSQNTSQNTDKLIEEFETLKGEDDICAFMVTLKKQAQLLKDFFIFISKDGNYELGPLLKKDDEEMFDFGSDEIKTKRRLISLQSFLHVSTEPHHWLIPAFDWSSGQNKNINAEKFISTLEIIDNKLIQETRILSSVSNPEEMTYRNVSHYWFYRLDYELLKLHLNSDSFWSAVQDEAKDLLNEFRFRRCGSIEHINPQTLADGTKNLIPVNCFGNLALISNSRNSKFSNNPPEGKKKMILQSESKYTESLKMLHYLWCNPGSHNESDLIQKESEVMYKILNEAISASKLPDLATRPKNHP